MQKNTDQFYIDQLAIKQLIGKYTDVINCRKWEELENIFALNAVWKAGKPIDLEFNGLQDILVCIPENVEKLELLVQTSSGIVIDVKNCNEASARSLLSEFGHKHDGLEKFQAIGLYHDLLTKENGKWKFILREFELKHYALLV